MMYSVQWITLACVAARVDEVQRCTQEAMRRTHDSGKSREQVFALGFVAALFRLFLSCVAANGSALDAERLE